MPYIPNIDKWVRHFEDISAGRVRPGYKGCYIVGSGFHNSGTIESRTETYCEACDASGQIRIEARTGQLPEW